MAIPVGNDQPGVAARLKWSGAGKFLPMSQLRGDRLHALVLRVLNHTRYGESARELQRGIQASGGLKQAADIVERAARKAAQTGPKGHLRGARTPAGARGLSYAS